MERALPTLPHLDEGDERILQLLVDEPASHHRNCFRSAIQHLYLSYRLQAVDAAMAIFRAITAEEEAASGLMRCLIDRKYPNAEKLRPRDHVQKHAVTPFLQSMIQYLGHLRFNGLRTVRLAIKDINGTARLVVAMQVGQTEESAWASATPPLNMSLREGHDQTTPTFRPDFQQLIKQRGYKNIRSFLQSEANLRNRILYAAKDGFPLIEDLKVEFIVVRQRRVFSMLKTLLLISPYAEHQPFVSDALQAFLQLDDRLNSEPRPDDG